MNNEPFDHRYLRITPIYEPTESVTYRKGYKHGIVTGAILVNVIWIIFEIIF